MDVWAGVAWQRTLVPVTVAGTNVLSVAETAVGLGGLKPPLDPKTPWSPPLAPLHFGEEKMRKKERKKRGKKKSAPPLRISGFATASNYSISYFFIVTSNLAS